ncbi:MAG: RnfH family protein [Gammaproteobacteria bacterium]|nr:RnfH family protein [Gammaproteobacteria bacterium]
MEVVYAAQGRASAASAGSAGAAAEPDTQVVIELKLPPGTTVTEAIHRSGLPERFPEIDLEKHGVGIFGELVGLGDPLRDGDRVEIYRPLLADPKAIRRERAVKRKKGK